MGKDKFEHKDELDCEVTVFDGSYTTCDTDEKEESNTRTASKDRLSKKSEIKDNYNI